MDLPDENGRFWMRNWLHSYLRHGPSLTAKERETMRRNMVERMLEQRKAQELLDQLALER